MSAAEEDITPKTSSDARAVDVVSTSEPRFPSVMIVLTFCYAGALFLAFQLASELDDRFSVGPDIIMVAGLFSGFGMMLLWIGWFLIRSNWKWWARILASVAVVSFPVALQKIFRPVLGGDVTIQRFEPIWATPSEVPTLSTEGTESVVDLSPESAIDFPRFLGATQDAKVNTGIQLDVSELASAKILWKQPIGEGWCGFVARNGFAVTMEQRQDKECVTCYDIEDGSLQWMHQNTARHQDVMNLGRVGPRATPLIHDGLVYSVGAVGNFVCLNGADGSEVWSVDLNELLGIELGTSEGNDGQQITFESNSRLAWGRSGSPLVVDDLIIVPGGGPKDGPVVTLLAFDKTTGELRWKGGDQMIAYGSPTLANIAGVDQVLITAEKLAMGFDPRTGEKLWDYSRPGESDSAANTSQLTVVSPNRLLTSKGYPDGGGELIELTNEGGRLIPKRVWQNTRALKTKLMSPIIHDNYSYSLSNGFLECVRMSSGERVWKHRGRFGHGQMLLIGEDMLVHSEAGELSAFSPSSQGYKGLESFKTIDGVCWNTLCLYGNKLLVRSEIEAACVELPAK